MTYTELRTKAFSLGVSPQQAERILLALEQAFRAGVIVEAFGPEPGPRKIHVDRTWNAFKERG